MEVGELKEDEAFLDAAYKTARIAWEKAQEQSGERIEWRPFVWGFWLGASYERCGIIKGTEECPHHGEGSIT